MARHDSDKVRLLAVYNMLLRGKKISCKEIIIELKNRFGIVADRKTIYSDVYAINRIIPIEAIPGCKGGYIKVDVIGRCEDEM